MFRTRSYYVHQFSTYLKKNWVNLVVLGVVLSLSAASSGIIYAYATESITNVSNEMLTVSLGDIKSRVDAYLSASIAIIPAAKAFLEARTIDTGANPKADVIAASRMWGYFYNASASFSLFYIDPLYNNLGWGRGQIGSIILLHWPSVYPGLNTYIPTKDGAIGNVSAPFFHADMKPIYPPLEIVKVTGKPMWTPVSLLTVAQGDTIPLLSYVAPAYFTDSGDFCCIVGTNVYIRSFEQVLSSYEIAKTGKIFIADEQGLLIADSENGLGDFLNTVDSQGVNIAPVMPNATANKDPILAHAARYLVKKFGSFAEIPEEDQFFTFSHKGSTQILLVGQYAREDSLKVFITIVVPYSAFFAAIDLSRRITISLTVVAAIFGCVRYLFAFRLIAKKHATVVAPTPSETDRSVSISVSTHAHSHPSSQSSSTQSSRNGSSAALIPNGSNPPPRAGFT